MRIYLKQFLMYSSQQSTITDHSASPYFPFSLSSSFQSPLLHSESHIISGRWKVGPQFKKEVLVTLTSTQIFLQDNFDLYQAPLVFELKFRVLEIKNPHISYGIAFYFENSTEGLTLSSEDVEKVQVWRAHLLSRINCLGFHNFFKARSKLGKGNFATVFEVQSLENGFKYAAKAFSKNHIKTLQNGYECIKNQVKILRSLQHPNLLKNIGVFQSDNSIYIVSELLKGGTIIDRTLTGEKRMNKEQIQQIITGILKGLAYLHDIKKIVHRDIKLQNIMFRSIKNFQPVIIDFGLSAYYDDEKYLFSRCGTPGYVAPQIMNGEKMEGFLSPQSDIFSVGVILHYLLTCQPLFIGKNQKEVFEKNKRFSAKIDCHSYPSLEPQAFHLLQLMLEPMVEHRISTHHSIIHPFLHQHHKLRHAKTTHSRNESSSFNNQKGI